MNRKKGANKRSLSNSKKKKFSKSALTRNHSRRDCKACNEVELQNINKVNPSIFTQDYEKLAYFTKLYQQFVLQGKITQAEQLINKIKANHPIFSRL